MENLTLEIIESYGFESKVSKPDWDDTEITFTLPNGLQLSTLTVCNNEPCEIDSLEGLNGFIYITTKQQLDKLINQSYEDVCLKLAETHENFDIDEYL